MKSERNPDQTWTCSKCRLELKEEKARVEYLGGSFEVELMRCPKCKMAFINEDLALGKMLEVEKSLEDK